MVLTSSWHWQERFEPLDVENACRRQILKVQRSKSYTQWLKEKTRAKNQAHEVEVEHHGNNEDKKAECDAAFRDFLRRKRKEAKKQHTKAPMKPWCKPPSLHVNPKTKKKVSTRTNDSPPYLRRERSEVETQQAYSTWLARIRLEDRVRRAQRHEELDRLEQQQREKHKVTWRKKLAVCSYSTLVLDN
ncbi:hypothetical protein V7S43_002611 [Phytophthora oleae]|uniref:Uncharacterized protein n=1 Tax=Phytophthora oleae TaxID=2107226 RepID=A0ABD3G3Z9_9STRA